MSRLFVTAKAVLTPSRATSSFSTVLDMLLTRRSTGARNSDKPIPVPTPSCNRLEKSPNEAIVPSVSAEPNIRALRSVREQRGFEIAEVAAFADISADRLDAFEKGERAPSRKQLEKLASTYGVPLYSLFGDAIPNLPPLPQDFRKPTPSEASLSPGGVRTLLASERISEFAKQLALQLDYTPERLVAQRLKPRPLATLASELRATFDAWLAPRAKEFAFSGTDEQRFMSAFRLFFEVQGGVLNVNVAPTKDYMGFFVKPDAGLPTIFINRVVSSRKAQLFTLAHEYAHSLNGQDGISNPFRPRNAIERSCNVFAAEFLAPMSSFTQVVERLTKSQRSDVATFVAATASNTLLSKHAAAIRLVEADYIKQAELQSWRKIFSANPRSEKDEEKEQEPESAGGQPHAKRLGELGHLPVYLAKQAVDQQIIDSFDVADSLGLSRSLQTKAFSLAERRFEIALR
jgi:Zn-dependent peptidase ImmA (M78 family)